MVTAADLANVINNAGRALDWTRSYRNVAGTTIGAAYRATGLDENTAKIAVDAESARRIAEEIISTAERFGLGKRTAVTYAGTWKRVSALAHAWRLAGGTEDFWDNPDLIRSRHARKHRTSTDNTQTTTVRTSRGLASVNMSPKVTDEDRLRIVRAILDTETDT